MTEERIRDLTASYIEAQWGLKEVIDDVGGNGLCEHYSERLMWWFRIHEPIDDMHAYTVWMNLKTRKVADHEFEIPEEYQADGREELNCEHCVLWFPKERIAVDLTAKQFDETLPFPFIWRVK
jgi:hypothetical protein